MEVPSFLLRRLYVRGSLRNVEGGFVFELKNSLGSGYADAVLPLQVDGVEVPPGAAQFVVDGAAARFDEITAEKPMTLGLNRALTVQVRGRTLEPGKHKIAMGFVVTGMGEMQFDVTDVIDGDSTSEAGADG